MCTRFWIRGALMLVLAGATALTPTYAQNPFDQIKKAIEAARKPKVPAATPVPPATPMPGSSPAAAPTGAAGEPFKGKVQETLMGPMLGGPGVMARTSMSEDGDHLAIVTAKGSRQVVLIDGVEGPVFDEIPSVFFGMVQVSVQFSPTGGHSGYLGRRGGDLIAVVDGKEAGVVATSQTGTTVSGANGWTFWFNQDGSHIAYAGYIGSNNWQMVADGVKSPALPRDRLPADLPQGQASRLRRADRRPAMARGGGWQAGAGLQRDQFPPADSGRRALRLHRVSGGQREVHRRR